jgi:hypothetical protein
MRSPFNGRIYLVAVEREVFPPVSFGNSTLQRMRVMLAPPDLPPATADLAPVAPRSREAAARPVKGEILRDDKGRYYEKIGNTVRELGRLEATSEGDLVEAEQPSNPAEENPAPSRKLFSDPGQWRVLQWGQFKALLAGQIAHPERLRDDHRLPCYVQVAEAGSREPVAAFAKSVFGTESIARELMMLSPQAAERLELKALLPPPRNHPASPRERGILLPGDRLFHLRVAMDPTADSTPSAPPPNRQVPESYSTQSFPRTREEVLLEMRTPAGISGRLTGWTHSLFARARFNLWQRALWGKPPDEQLWAVPPPAAMLTDPAVREWATATLELAGYDAPAMLREWEIYWRRKRVS